MIKKSNDSVEDVTEVGVTEGVLFPATHGVPAATHEAQDPSNIEVSLVHPIKCLSLTLLQPSQVSASVLLVALMLQWVRIAASLVIKVANSPFEFDVS